LAAEGADVGVITRSGESDETVRLVERGADVIVMQRPMLRRMVEAIPRVQATGVAVVVDIDDDFTSLHHGNAVWSMVHPSFGPEPEELNSNWLREACRLADLVTVTTPRLARVYGGHGRVRIVPNHVPASMLAIPRPVNETVVVGWTGAVATHPGDLRVTRGGVARAVKSAGARFHVVGPPDGVADELGLADAPTSATGWVPLVDYPQAMARMDVGIVPLKLTEFNQAKSWLKAMEFAALGVPAVVSPTDPNVEFTKRVGYPLASSGADWYREVRRLIVDERHRIDLGGRARELMAAETVEGNCQMWWDAWSEAVRHRRDRRPGAVRPTMRRSIDSVLEYCGVGR
jgi:glycosyltransferase involved in cell wall biosynthesis